MKKPSKSSLPEWDLTTLLKSRNDIPKIKERFNAQVKSFLSYREKLENPSPALVTEILDAIVQMRQDSSKLGAYADLWFSQNTKNEEAKSLDANLSSYFTELGNETLFFSLWWKGLDDSTAQSLLPKNPDYRYHLQETRRYKMHTLSEPEEKIINTKDVTGSSALVRLYDIITNNFTYQWKEKGKTKTLTREELSTFVRDPKPAVRKQAYDTIWSKYAEHEGDLGDIYQNLARDHLSESMKMRRYATPISPRNLANNLSDETVESFLQVCDRNQELFRDYLKWKMKKLKVPYSRYNVYAPLPYPEQKVSFEQGWKTVMQVFNNFSPRVKQLAEKVRFENRLDVPIRPGKRSGAFCYGVLPKETSFVLLNWKGKDDDVFTLAHELGHAVHNHLASNRTVFTHHAGLPLAETASTFGEMLLTDHLLSQKNSDSYRRYLLAGQLDDAYGTVCRQASFCRFEQTAFDLVQQGKTTPELSDAYEKNLKNQFGNMQLPPNARYEWLSIPHFYHSPFYVYAYSFGQLLVYALFEQYQEEGKSFVPKYEKFLSYGGSKKPEDMLLEMGFDPNKDSSWQQGFDFLGRQFKELKKM